VQLAFVWICPPGLFFLHRSFVRFAVPRGSQRAFCSLLSLETMLSYGRCTFSPAFTQERWPPLVAENGPVSRGLVLVWGFCWSFCVGVYRLVDASVIFSSVCPLRFSILTLFLLSASYPQNLPPAGQTLPCLPPRFFPHVSTIKDPTCPTTPTLRSLPHLMFFSSPTSGPGCRIPFRPTVPPSLRQPSPPLMGKGFSSRLLRKGKVKYIPLHTEVTPPPSSGMGPVYPFGVIKEISDGRAPPLLAVFSDRQTDSPDSRPPPFNQHRTTPLSF